MQSVPQFSNFAPDMAANGFADAARLACSYNTLSTQSP